MDPILSLAFAIHTNPGVYAVLAGSGMSRAAGIPTGWEVVLDLTTRLAALRGEDCTGDPEGWYAAAFGEAPDYRKLLNRIARSASERQRLLRAYFEPSPDDLAAGRKQPTGAHAALAALVKAGHVRVIMTTNFDRLIERSIEAAGVTPAVISTPDAVDGALPLTHASCTVVKLHGDYLDARLKNTESELAKYDRRVSRLLDRVLDEFGLIVCGWSADWDTALRAAFQRCKSRRFTTYWTARSPLSDTARQLVTHRGAVEVPIAGADEFFTELQQKVSALASFDTPHPLSSKAATAMVKRQIAERRHIELHDLVRADVERVYAATVDERMPVSGTVPCTRDTVQHRMAEYEALSSILRDVLIVGCYWGQREEDRLWVAALERLGNRPVTGGVSLWMDLRFYPALLLLYGGALGALARPNYGTLSALLHGPRLHARDNLTRDKRPLDLLYPQAILDQREGRSVLVGKERHYTPLNQHLFEVLREPLREVLPDDEAYQRTFDRFEYLFAVCYVASAMRVESGSEWFPVGCFAWRRRWTKTLDVATELATEADAAGTNWEPVKCGLFESRREFDDASQFVATRVLSMNWL